MSRSRDLANLANNATGLETLTVSDITDLTATATELNYVDGVSNPLQTQIDAKAPIASPTFTGTTNVSSGVTLPSNPTVTLGSNTTFGSGVSLSNATFPTKVTDRTIFYMAQKESNHYTSYDDYLITPNFVGGTIKLSGVAPAGFTDIVSAEIVTLDGQSGSNNLLNIRWMIGGNGQQYHTHSLSSTNIFNGTYVANNMRFTSFLNIGSSGSRFEDLIAEGDAFGIRIISSGSQNVYGLGAKITWRF